MAEKFDCTINNDKTDLDVDFVTDDGTFGFYYSDFFDIVSVHYNTHRVWRGRVTWFFTFVWAMVHFAWMLGNHMRIMRSEVDRYIFKEPDTVMRCTHAKVDRH